MQKAEAAGFARRLAAILALAVIPAPAFSATAEARTDAEETPFGEMRESSCKTPLNGTRKMPESHRLAGAESASLRDRAGFRDAYRLNAPGAGSPLRRPVAKAPATVPCPICSRESRSAVFIPETPGRGQARFTRYPVAHAGRTLAPEISIQSAEEAFRELMAPPNPMTESGGIFDAPDRSMEADGGEYIIMIRRDLAEPIFLKSVRGS